MASPEVERPMASPSNPVLSPHGLSPGTAGSSATLPSPGSNTSRKVVTFDQCIDPSADGNRELAYPTMGNLGQQKQRVGKHGPNLSGGVNQKHSSYQKYRQSGHRPFHSASSLSKYSADIENEDKNVLLAAAGDNIEVSKLLPPSGGATQTHANTQTKRFRGGIRKRSYSFSEGNLNNVKFPN